MKQEDDSQLERTSQLITKLFFKSLRRENQWAAQWFKNKGPRTDYLPALYNSDEVPKKTKRLIKKYKKLKSEHGLHDDISKAEHLNRYNSAADFKKYIQFILLPKSQEELQDLERDLQKIEKKLKKRQHKHRTKNS